MLISETEIRRLIQAEKDLNARVAEMTSQLEYAAALNDEACRELKTRVAEMESLVDELYPLIATHYDVPDLRARVNALLPDQRGKGG